MQELGTRTLQAEGKAGAKSLINWKKFGMLLEGKKKRVGHSDDEGQGKSGM